MSIFKSNKFFRIIKHFILALPLMFVLGTSLYAIVNPNAKDSYSGEEVVNFTYFENKSDIPLNTTIYSNINTNTNFQNTNYMSFYDLEVINTNTDFVLSNDMVFIRYYAGKYVIFYDSNKNPLKNVDFNGTAYLNISFKLYANSQSSYNPTNMFFVYDIGSYQYLNNAFEFGMYQFTQIGFGQFDFISLFNGIFTTNINNVYASFINDYINYYLFVEIVYFAPWVFHAFIHFAYDLGDYFTSSFKRNRKDDD